jgi:hypothetical protein
LISYRSSEKERLDIIKNGTKRKPVGEIIFLLVIGIDYKKSATGTSSSL